MESPRSALATYAFTISSWTLAACAATTGTSQPSTGARPLDGALVPAIIEPAHVAAAVTAESTLATRYDSLAPGGTEWFVTHPDTGAVLIVAPHATSQMRNGEVKRPDAGTGSLAVTLSRLTGAAVIYTTYRAPSDPNYYDQNDFKRRLAVLVDSLHPLMVLDLHASAYRRPYDIDFGTMAGASLHGREDLLHALSTTLAAEGVTNQSRERFPASANQTVTKWVSARGVPAIQLEINSVWLLYQNADAAQEHRFAQLLQGLTRFIRYVHRPGS